MYVPVSKIGRWPYRRTLHFLESSTTLLENGLHVVAMYFNTQEEHSHGLRDFVLRDLPRVQYKNPDKQYVLFRDHYKKPHISLYWGTGDKLLLDCYRKTADDIVELLRCAAMKPASELIDRKLEREEYPGNFNVANFGSKGQVYCICMRPGQVACSSKERCPSWGKKWWMKPKEER